MKTPVCLMLTIFLGLALLRSTENAAVPSQKDVPGNTPSSSSPMSVDESRVLVKAIPSVDIPWTLGKWKLQEPELVTFRQWSQALVENSGRNDFIPKWAVLVREVCLKNKGLRGPDLPPLIQMIMLAAYEQAQKEMATGSTEAGNKNELRKQFAGQLRENISQARQLEGLARFSRRELTDPLSGSGLGLPTVQRMLRKCELQEQGEGKIQCKEILVSTDFELKDYISSTESQLKQVEDELRRSPVSSQPQEGKGKARLYALSEVARQMHEAAIPYVKK